MDLRASAKPDLAISLAQPDIEAGPLPIGSANLVSLKVGEEVQPPTLLFSSPVGSSGEFCSVRQRFILRCLCAAPIGRLSGDGRNHISLRALACYRPV
jgi:hypothetical protein